MWNLIWRIQKQAGVELQQGLWADSGADPEGKAGGGRIEGCQGRDPRIDSLLHRINMQQIGWKLIRITNIPILIYIYCDISSTTTKSDSSYISPFGFAKAEPVLFVWGLDCIPAVSASQTSPIGQPAPNRPKSEWWPPAQPLRCHMPVKPQPPLGQSKDLGHIWWGSCFCFREECSMGWEKRSCAQRTWACWQPWSVPENW